MRILHDGVMKRERFDTKRIWRKIMCIRQDNQQMGAITISNTCKSFRIELLGVIRWLNLVSTQEKKNITYDSCQWLAILHFNYRDLVILKVHV